jgi:multidrug resistance protein MdtO
MCVLQDFAPATDFEKIRDRLVGILLGIVVTTLVYQYLWPEPEPQPIP